MKSYVMSFAKYNPDTTVVSTKIAKFIAETLSLDLLDNDDSIVDSIVEAYNNLMSVDTLIIVNGASAFCKWLEPMAQLASIARRVIWVMNDYTVYPPTQLRKVFNDRPELIVETWSTVPELPDTYKGLKIWTRIPLKATHYVNWNSLTYRNIKPLAMDVGRLGGLFYYGAFREDRESFFEHYFGDHVQYPVVISASAKAAGKFKERYPHATTIKPFKTLEEIQKYEASILIQDNSSIDLYCSPPNRVYECLSAGIALFIDTTALNTMKKAGFNLGTMDGHFPRDYMIVDRCTDLAERLENKGNLYRLMEWQGKHWREPFVSMLKQELIEIWSGS